MPKGTDISKIFVLGSGPIIIGQSADGEVVLKGRTFRRAAEAQKD